MTEKEFADWQKEISNIKKVFPADNNPRILDTLFTEHVLQQKVGFLTQLPEEEQDNPDYTLYRNPINNHVISGLEISRWFREKEPVTGKSIVPYYIQCAEHMDVLLNIDLQKHSWQISYAKQLLGTYKNMTIVCLEDKTNWHKNIAVTELHNDNPGMATRTALLKARIVAAILEKES